MFWGGHKYLSKGELYIDQHSLRLLMIYIIIQTKQSKLKIDIDLVHEFMPKVLQYTNRAFYITMLQSAYEYIENLTDSKLSELYEKSKESKEYIEPILSKSNLSCNLSKA